MLQNLILFFLGLVVQNFCSPPETAEQTKRCDKKSLLIMRTECQSCSLNFGIKCPDGYTKVTNGSMGVRDCRYTFEVRTYSLSLPGCRHICRKTYLQPQCCPGHWGPDCMECPGGASSPCSGRGSCAEGMGGNGSCSCQKGFGGTACETCADDNLFGPNCSAVCSCVHGVCISGIAGNGTCECHSAYTGPNCDKPIPECAALLCPQNSRCSPSSEDETKLECKCLPSYKGNGQFCEPINPCLQNICHPHARCTYLGPNRHSCTCQEGYHGDGRVCLPVDPCQTNFGNCPTKSTVCIYDGPGQSHCECKKHYHNFEPGVGCSVTDICASHNPCHRNANCTTIAPGQTKCTCQKGYVGDGSMCYGNIMERLRELNTKPRGKWQGRLTSFISLLDKAYAWPLSNLGPFTVLLPTDKGLKGLNDNQLTLKLYGGKKNVKIIQGNITASNGLLHILDRAMDKMAPTFESNSEQTIMTMLQPRYSKFRSLLEKTNVGHALDKDGVGGPYTIFVPSNEALNNMKDGTLDYLLSPEGSWKLLELIRYHIVPFTQLEVASLISTPHIRSMANQIIQFKTTENGTCVSCSLVHWSKCPANSEPTALFTHRCVYTGKTRSLKSGCAKYCNATVKVPKCCKGFYGSDCNQCPGGFSNPCSGNGQCADGLGGNGTCICQDGFQGSQCQFCSDPNKYGPRCDKKCLCIYGTCDNRIDSDGACLAGTCRDGSTGRFCHKQTSACGPYVQFCHIHATCEYSNGTASCVCKAGYEGDGSLCSESDPCSGLTLGGCSRNAECIKTGTGTHSCVCQQGWTGNGRDCSEINNCLLPGAGSCHDNATCLYVGPGQNECECKEGFRGNGIDCEPITSCLEQTEKCHPLATCQFTSSGIWSCVCQEGYEGDGFLCYGNAAVVLFPQRGLTGSLPNLLTRLDQMPDYSIFRGYIIQFNLANAIEAADAYTVFAPNNDAIENYIREKKVTTLEEDILRYHVVLEEKLLKNDLHNGMHRETMLGVSYLLSFFLHSDQLYVNEAPINYTNVATDKGVIHGLGKVLEIQKNRCDNSNTTIVRTRECCAGFFGPQCQPCPGKAQNVCFGNGICLDGVNGTGVCECGEGFSGTACETCVEGKYGIHCDQECSCVHGRCNQGPSGDGSCECDVGWRGVKCDREITKDNCNGTCHTSANCLLNPDGTALCKCAVGFQGNGTICTEINPCLENHGGCDKNAECTQTGPNQAVCNCLPKYTGDGKDCSLINTCLTKNGGCSEFAICNHTGQEERTCTCKPNYIGDGFTCRGNIHQELPKNPKTSQYFFQLLEHSVRDLVGSGPFTVFAPLSAAFDEEPRIKDWDKQGLMPQVLRYHVIACHQLLLENLKSTPNATSLQGESIVISVSQDTVYINNKAKIISSDIISTNGIIHIIDKVLSPQNMLITPQDASGRILQNLTTVAINHGYIKFNNLIQGAGLLSIISDPIHTPVTLFWPTDQALQALPAEQRDFLFNQDNKDKLKEYLKFHVIRDAKVSAADLPRSTAWKTLQGSELSVKCGAGSDIGELFLNDQTCRIVQRELLFDLGVAYGIDCLLIDPTLGGRCDTFATFNVSGDCGSCVYTPSCPRWTKPKGVKQKCLYNLPFKRNLEGCRQQCALVIQLSRCCKGYFGRDCQACPGGPDTPCNNRGVCLDQYSATGECKCNTGFNGTACELCWPGRFGPDCQPCGCSDHGQCDEGITGSGQCLCEAGWTGRFCDTRAVLPPVCTPPCSAHATCKENNTCECNLNYEGDGLTCTVVDFCKQNNGGCAKVAKCSQKGTKVSCSCSKGYQGDGHSCTEIDPCADGLNGGCHEHATCKMTGPGKKKCECKSHYVGDGLDCEPEQLPIDRCLQDNGQCHADASCADLHFQDSTVGVFHLRSPLGQYKLTFDKAKEACANEAATMATYNQLSYAQKAKYHLCSAGWLESGRVAYPTAYASQNCGSGVVGIVDYGPRNNKSEMWDVFCYRMKDVNCTCKVGYVGDGFSCSGNLLQVLMSFPSLTNFLMGVLAYSNSSARGRAFLKHLTDLSIRSTLFVPQNSGLGENETLSGRDIEHHFANVSIFFYNDLVNGTILQTRLGSQLLITSSQDQGQLETRFVDGRAILQWDIFASNGIIHVISRPLKAPPAPVTAVHTGLGTGIFFAITLVIGAIALAAYSYFRLHRRTTGFQRFESEEDIDVTALGKRQPENVSNPMYESATSAPPEPSYDPFTVSEEQQLESGDPLGVQ
ncbi:LOW QUALITY PROTEIN: stabilin-2 [Pteropus vampyrus]|uniref:Stabilin-2 n=1 Tax=Pteropus vampyrus TaxID=132908 RepID=A0A6P6C778_PTEVA|nr:LOW QUALITY PROTEIN: stabilin-2 [Pteropus vampyrus]